MMMIDPFGIGIRRVVGVAVIGAIVVLPVSIEAVRRAPDLMGSYCAARSPRRCCENRSDGCSVPLRGTLCYCDQFCSHGYKDDCCPDYWEVCVNPEYLGKPKPLTSCFSEGKQYQANDTFLSNCNKCTCGEEGIKCDRETCVADELLLSLLRRMRPQLGWTAANYTFFWGRKLSEALVRRGGTPHPQGAVNIAAKNAAALARAHGEPVPQTPARFDAREHWPGLVGDIHDQGWCDTAWALTTASVASDRLAIQTGGVIRDRLSSQELLDCSRSLQNGCDVGGHLDRAWNYMRRKGVSAERCYIWSGSQDKCRAKPGRCKRYKTGPVYPLPGEDTIRYDIYTSGPVQATMRLYRDFFSYRGGIYRRSPESKSHRTGFHVVKIVGWSEENGTKYWIAANSWGPTWGEKGYFRILRGSNECDIENFVLAAWGPPIGNFTTVRPPLSNDIY